MTNKPQDKDWFDMECKRQFENRNNVKKRNRYVETRNENVWKRSCSLWKIVWQIRILEIFIKRLRKIRYQVRKVSYYRSREGFLISGNWE